MSHNFVSSIERGVHGVDIVRIRRITLALDISFADLVPPTETTTDSLAAMRTRVSPEWSSPPSWPGEPC